MNEPLLTLPKQDIHKLLAAGSGDAALLYLYLRAGNDPDRAADALQMNAYRYDCTMASLRQMGLIEEKVRYLEPGERPVYTEKDITREMDRSKHFGQLVGEVQRRLGRTLSTEELKILLSMLDYLRLPNEVVSVLISFCMQRNRARGNVRAPSMRSIEKEAYVWADNGIDTLEEAIAYVQQQLARQSRLGSIRRSLQIHDRRLTQSEERYILKWLEMGFGEPEIQLAYDRTCLNCGSLKWQYMNSILVNWQTQNLYTVDQILKYDKAPERTAPAKYAQPVQTGVDPMAKKAIERLLKQKEET